MKSYFSRYAAIASVHRDAKDPVGVLNGLDATSIESVCREADDLYGSAVF